MSSKKKKKSGGKKKSSSPKSSPQKGNNTPQGAKTAQKAKPAPETKAVPETKPAPEVHAAAEPEAAPEENTTPEVQTAPEEQDLPAAEVAPEEEAPPEPESAPEEAAPQEEQAPQEEKAAPEAKTTPKTKAAKRGKPAKKGKPDPKQRSRFPMASSPHIISGDSVRVIMLDVMIALVPALGVSTYFFGPRVLAMTLVAMVSCVFFELLYRLLLRKSVSIGDLSACVTGMLLAMCLPVGTPYWMAAAGSFFAIVVVKQLYGGLGKNFMNPALAGRVFLFSFPALMNTWAAAGTDFWPGLDMTVDAVTAATPMASLHQGLLPDLTLREMLLGAHGGALGEVASFALILGGLYLAARKVISLRIPVFYIGTVAALTYLFPLGGNNPLDWMLYNLLGGGLLLGAIFMATDPVTSPVTPRGQVLYAVGCGGLTVFLRYFGAYPEGVSFAILIMNASAWLLDKAGIPRRLGAPWPWQKKKGGNGP